MMKFLLWNVNGLRAISKKTVITDKDFGFAKFLCDFDIVVLNETKIGERQLKPDLLPRAFPHAFYAHSTTKAGYSGVSVLSKQKPLWRVNPPFEDSEGRIIILEFEQFTLVVVYVPNSGEDLKRLKLHTETWDAQFRLMCADLAQQRKPLVVLGDMNVAHERVDVHAPARLAGAAGFTGAKRENFGALLAEARLTDVWRKLHPDQAEFTYFNYRTQARARNKGWRLDYALVSERLLPVVIDCAILHAVVGSDHLPLLLSMNF
ncbi:hypothetical protein PI124_g17651 [Phytophthora idaei]|nr:hypothetical protein PI125_g18338 [Phytophthora idaei]KAG3237363.1 hypothetical protein PI124_g17651 [Phytophthora idaei]